MRALTGLVLIVLVSLLSASPALAQNGCGSGPPERSLFLSQDGAGGGAPNLTWWHAQNGVGTGPPRQIALPAQQWQIGDLVLAGALTALLAAGAGLAVTRRSRREG